MTAAQAFVIVAVAAGWAVHRELRRQDAMLRDAGILPDPADPMPLLYGGLCFCGGHEFPLRVWQVDGRQVCPISRQPPVRWVEHDALACPSCITAVVR